MRILFLSCRFASESNIIRYAKIAMQLKNKTVRDVALRVRWMTVSIDILILGTSRPLFCHNPIGAFILANKR